MIDFGTLLAVGFAFWVVAASPGPANIANASVAMQHGRKSSLIFGAGLSTALMFWGLVAATGMGAILQTSVWVLMVLKGLGALYLFWLAWHSARSAARKTPLVVSEIKSGRWFSRGLLLNLSNPKSVIAWMAALSVGLDPSDTFAAVAATTLICVFVGFANNAVYSLAFSTNGMMGWYQRSRRWIEGVVAGLFAAAGLVLLKSAFSK